MTLAEIARVLDGALEGGADPLRPICGVAPLDAAGPDEISFLANSRYARQSAGTRAAAVIVDSDYLAPAAHQSLIRVENAYLAFAKALSLLCPEPLPAPGRHTTAVVHANAAIAADAYIGPLCVIGEKVIVGPGCVLDAGCILESGCRLGRDCRLHSRVVLARDTVCGDRVIIQSGAVIGSDGFGFAPDRDGIYHKIPQTGNVVLEDDVEIGANTTVDRAVMGATVIRRGTKLDNLVQVAHNVDIGEHTVIAGQAGISGSTRLGKHVMVGGQAGFVGHIHVGDRAVITAQAGVSQDVPPGEIWSDTPARPFMRMRRIQAALMRLPELFKRVKKLEEET